MGKTIDEVEERQAAAVGGMGKMIDEVGERPRVSKESARREGIFVEAVVGPRRGVAEAT